ncbi:Uncharacterised protein [Acinetobacter baumannii]|nr:Uncharacterised protein [Acinetobacter baumannii]
MLPSRPDSTPPCQPNFHAITTFGKNTTISSRRSISGDSTICVPMPITKNRLHQMIKDARSGGLAVSSPSRW